MQYNGFYRGIVVDNNDPLKSGRVRIRIYPMFKDIDNIETLPWAIYADPSMGGIADTGSINVPKLNSHVFCFFENGDFRYPVYFSAAPAIENDIPDSPTLSRESDATVTDINANAEKNVPTASGATWSEPDSFYAATYPNNSVYKSKNGIIVEIDDTDDNVRMHVYHPSGTRNEVNNFGDKVAHTARHSYMVVVGNDNAYIKGTKSITVDGNMDVYCKSAVNIKVDGNATINVGGDGIVDIAGSATLGVGANMTTNVGGNYDITVTGNYSVTAARIDLN